jgi:hypothetical protein
VRQNLRQLDPHYRSSGSSGDSDYSEEEISFNERGDNQSSPTVKMSKFYEVRPAEIQNFLQTHKIYNKENTTHFRLQYCPICPKPHHGDPSNMYTMNILKSTGGY